MERPAEGVVTVSAWREVSAVLHPGLLMRSSSESHSLTWVMRFLSASFRSIS